MNNSKKALQAALREVCFDPRKPGALAAIVSCNDPAYLVQRAEEFLRDSKRFSNGEQRARLRDAAAVLAYAMTLVEKTNVLVE